MAREIAIWQKRTKGLIRRTEPETTPSKWGCPIRQHGFMERHNSGGAGQRGRSQLHRRTKQLRKQATVNNRRGRVLRIAVPGRFIGVMWVTCRRVAYMTLVMQAGFQCPSYICVHKEQCYDNDNDSSDQQIHARSIYRKLVAFQLETHGAFIALNAQIKVRDWERPK